MDAVGWCSYESPNLVAMLFLSVEEARTREIAQAFFTRLVGYDVRNRAVVSFRFSSTRHLAG